MPAALTPPWKVHTPIREPPVMRENASATATAYRSSRIISIGTPSRPSALFTRQTGKVETQPTPSCFKMRTMPVATSIVMDVVSLAWSRAVSWALSERKFLVTAFGDLIGRPPEMRAIAIVAQNAAHGPALDVAIDAVLPGIDLERQQRFACLDHYPRPLVHVLWPGLHMRVVVLLHEPQHARLEFDAV